MSKLNLTKGSLNYLKGEEKVVVAVSGGVDSVVLLDRLVKELGNEKVVVAHLHHGLREESNEELTMVANMSKNYGVTFEYKKLDVYGYCAKKGVSMETGARELRYNFFNEVMDKYGTKTLVIAHHGDDLVETMSMRLVNGTSLNGLIGMRDIFKDGDIVKVRPLLDVTKAELYKYAEEEGLEWAEDVTNHDQEIKRNRYRSVLLPFAKGENSQVHLAFNRLSEELAEEKEYWDELMSDTYEDLVKEEQGLLKVNREGFNNLRKAEKKRFVRYFLKGMGVINVDSHIVSEIMEWFTKGSKSGTVKEVTKEIKLIEAYGELWFLTSSYETYVNEVAKTLETEGYEDVTDVKNDRMAKSSKRVAKLLQDRKVVVEYRTGLKGLKNEQGEITKLVTKLGTEIK